LLTHGMAAAREALRPLFAFMERRPLPFGIGLCFLKGTACDFLVQRYVETQRSLSYKRMLVFGTFSAVFCGMWQYALFVKLMPRLCPGAEMFVSKPFHEKVRDGAGLRNLAKQVFIENGFNNGLLYFPIFYSVQTALEKGSIVKGVHEAPRKYLANAHTDVPDIWKVWVPVQAFNFAFSPLWLRVPLTACVSAFWTGYVSLKRGAYDGI